MKLPVKLTFNQFFGIIVLSVIVIYSGFAISVQSYRDFKETKVAREESQRAVADLLLKSLREPLIQGSYVEAKLRAQSTSEIPHVACISIKAKDIPIESCNVSPSKEIFEVDGRIYFDEAKTQAAADVKIFFDNSDLYPSIRNKILAAIVQNLVLALIVYLILSYASRVLGSGLTSIVDESAAENRPSLRPGRKRWLVIAEFAYLQKQMVTHMSAARTNAETRAAGEIARQVKHDIRSPLAALNNIIRSIPYSIGEEKRGALQSAIDRINEIANDLTHKNPENPVTKGSKTVGPQFAPLDIGNIVEDLISESRLQHKDRQSVFFDLNIDLDAGPALARVCPTKLKRSLSNVLNNSVEAIADAGCVTISISGSDNRVRIAIVDDGKGIAPDRLPDLGQKGMTFDKVGGTGLGLYYANSSINEFGGSLAINSDGLSGTSVTIELPRFNANQSSACPSGKHLAIG